MAQGLGMWLPRPRLRGAVQSQGGSVSPALTWVWDLSVCWQCGRVDLWVVAEEALGTEQHMFTAQVAPERQSSPRREWTGDLDHKDHCVYNNHKGSRKLGLCHLVQVD